MVAGQLPQMPEQRHGLARQRRAMPAPHFHAPCGYRPNRRLKVEFGPFGVAQFAGPHKGQGQQVKRDAGGVGAGIAGDSPPQAAKGNGIDNRRAMFGGLRGQGAAQREGRIWRATAGRDGVAKDLPDQGAKASRGFMAPARFDGAAIS